MSSPLPPRHHRLLPTDRLQTVAGWAENTRVASYVYRPVNLQGIQAIFALAQEKGVPIGLRGGGLSYGDASLLGESISLNLSRMNRILHWNPSTGVITVEPGVTIRQLWEHVIEDGWWPPVVSGTMFPTLGGAAAMNIHGKNHLKAGTLGENILSFDFLLPSGEVVTCAPDGENRDLFYQAIGSFGMLGVFTSLTLQMKPIASGLLRTTRWQARDLSEMFTVFSARLAKGEAEYLVGWIDGLATGGKLGRGLIEEAVALPPGEDPAPDRTRTVAFQSLPDTVFGWLPKSVLWRLARPWVNRPGVRLANAAQYFLGARGAGVWTYQTYAAVNFKLDYIPDWKRAYGAGGLMQYQVFVPADEAERVFRLLLLRAQERGLPPFLTVFKRHRPDPFPMSYGGDGWSLALDFPLTAGNREHVWSLAAELDPLVLDSGGRFYFAKDSTLHRSRLGSYLEEERVRNFLALKRRLDPDCLLQTDLFRRLFSPLPEFPLPPAPSPTSWERGSRRGGVGERE